MQYYNFEVLKGDETILNERSVGLLDPREAWPKIAELATKFDERGCRIRVTDQSGETVILIGVVSARSTLGMPPFRVSVPNAAQFPMH